MPAARLAASRSLSVMWCMRTDDEQAILSTKEGLADNTRLSCQIRLADDIDVRVINQASVNGIDPGTRPQD